jgi:hypothetical protein
MAVLRLVAVIDGKRFVLAEAATICAFASDGKIDSLVIVWTLAPTFARFGKM